MARIDTDKTINPSQLGVELGAVPLRHVTGRYVDADVDEATLQAAVDAHTADPDWTDPEAPAPEPTPDDELRDALLNFPAGGSPKQLADLLAGKDRDVRVPGRPTQ